MITSLVTLVTKLIFLQFERADLNQKFEFSDNSEFNYSNFKSCLHLIQFVARLNRNSLENIISLESTQEFTKNAFGFDSIHLVESFISLPKPAQTISGIVGILSAQKLIIVAIKGSISIEDLSLGINAISETIVLNPFQRDSSTYIGSYTLMPDIEMDQIDKGAGVGKGWYKYCYTIESKKANDNCYYDASCQVIPEGQYSKIDNECVFSQDKCSEMQKTMAEQIFDILKLYPDYQVIFTGHSMGACAATLLGYNYNLIPNHLHINSIYLYASPRIGNKKFVDQFNSFNLSVYNLINEKDIFTKIPTNLFQISEIINISSSKRGIIPNHDPQTYVQGIQPF